MATITNRGELQWRALIRRKGQTISKTFYYKSDAETWARKTESEIDRGIFINTSEAERMPLSELIERFRREILPTFKAQPQEKSRLKIIEQHLGKIILGSITASTVSVFRNERLKSVAENSADRDVTSLMRLLSFANNDCQIKLPNGIPLVKKSIPDDSRDRRVSDAEVDAICSNTKSKELASIVRFALLTAMRRNEIAKLKRINVDLSIPCFKSINTKNGKNILSPMVPAAADIIKSLPRRSNGYVFSLKGSSVTQAFNRARNRARAKYLKQCEANNILSNENYLVDLRFHDLRHEATSRLSKKLPNVIELSRVTGHKDLKMLDRYYQINVEDLAKKLA